MSKSLSEGEKTIIKAVIFDFDGVILESSDIKTEAFLELFKEYPEYQQTIFDYHIEHQGITRYQKFRWIYETLLKCKYTKEIEERLGEAFSDLVFHKIMRADFVPGAVEFLEVLKTRVPAFIASGTPDAELKNIISGRSLTKYFAGIYGSALSKEEIIRRIKEEKKMRSSELLFVGDAITDYNAAAIEKLHFIARNTPSMATFWKERDVRHIDDLLNISQYYDFSEASGDV